jgi:peptide/nickel transport system permease protein
MPSFWVGSLLIMILGAWLKIFPVSGIQSIANSENWPFLQRLVDWAYHLVLPVICLAYNSIAFLSKQMQNAMLETLSTEYIQTAKAKGLSSRTVIWKHAFKNSLFPMITLFANIFPAMVGGSVIIETIFSLPGMGFLLYQSIYARDYPVMIAVFTLSGVMTILGILVSDILYKQIDPRVQFDKS